MKNALDFKTLQDKKTVFVIFILAFIFVLLRNAWVSDDAYITFRTVENFLGGYGLTYNVAERVQTYTHPLWMFLLSGVYFIINRVFNIYFWAELYYLSLAVSLVLSVATVSFLMNRIARSSLMAIMGVTTLLFSKAFVDYSTSGLENPLTHFILVLFLWVFFKEKEITHQTLFQLSLIAALGTLNRLDILLVFLPALIYAFWKVEKKRKGIYVAFLGFLPLILWEIFSLFYYGFLLPNTAYAKLNTGITMARSLRQGFYYYLNSISLDPITLLIIVLAIVMAIMLKKKRQYPIVLGIILYLLYTLRVGGDFMSGRFFAVPFLASLALLTLYKFSELKTYTAIFFVILLFGLTSPRSPLLSFANVEEAFGKIVKIDEKGIADERIQYYSHTGLLLDRRGTVIPGSEYAGKAWKITSENALSVEVTGALGVFGYVRGPDIYIIDVNALADPLLARLPTQDPITWRIGHFKRHRPDGYIATLETGENQIADENLALYYEKLAIITRGEIFDWERIVEIWNMNTGKYDTLLAAYVESGVR